MPSPSSRTPYHHGDLPSALVEAALELIAEHGTRGFSVAQAARRTGVSTSAPYRHFADRDELLAAVAAGAYEELRQRFEVALAGAVRPTDQLAAAAAAYVRFAAERRAMFDVMFGAGLDKSRYPELAEAAGELIATVCEIAAKLAPRGDDELTWKLVQAITGVAHGHAVLLLDGAFDEVDQADAIALAEQRAAAATRALLRGRGLLFESG